MYAIDIPCEFDIAKNKMAAIMILELMYILRCEHDTSITISLTDSHFEIFCQNMHKEDMILILGLINQAFMII